MSQLDISRLDFKQCALCANSSDLQASHIIPGFVFDWFRETSATGHFRFSQTPNRRVQDGLKPRMLCRDCEQLFSSWEKKFAEECFVPLNSGRTHNIIYGPWMLKFATSVSWRVLRVFVACGHFAMAPDHIMTKVDDTLQEWSQFLLGGKSHPGTHEQHMFMAGEIVGTSIINAPPNINRYCTRAIDFHADYTQDCSISYAKMGKFVLFGFVTMTHPRRWKGTKLHVQRGRIGEHGDIELPSDVSDFMFQRARLAAKRYAQMSERQRSKIRQSYEQRPDRADESETMQAMHYDVLMFGDKAFEITQPSIRSRAKKHDD